MNRLLWGQNKAMPLCLRCNRYFEKREIEETNPGGLSEIACVDWCPACNKLAMSIVYRDRSAYYERGVLYDPMKGGA